MYQGTSTCAEIELDHGRLLIVTLTITINTIRFSLQSVSGNILITERNGMISHDTMQNIKYIATTTDCWTARRQSFIGVTAHWIQPDSLESCSVALACKRLKGAHTYDVLAGALNDIHTGTASVPKARYSEISIFRKIVPLAKF